MSHKGMSGNLRLGMRNFSREMAVFWGPAKSQARSGRRREATIF